jgi:hypothetical protein
MHKLPKQAIFIGGLCKIHRFARLDDLENQHISLNILNG